MSAEPVGNAGVRQLMVAFGAVRSVTLQFTPEAVVPVVLLKTTVAPGSKLVPVMVNGTPPASGLEGTESDTIAGTANTGGVCPAARNATNCITQSPDPKTPVAL